MDRPSPEYFPRRYQLAATNATQINLGRFWHCLHQRTSCGEQLCNGKVHGNSATREMPFSTRQWKTPPETTNDETVVAATDCDTLLEVPPATDTSPAPASTNGTDVEKNKRNRWCIEHGFYALMGGYVVSVKEEDEWILDDGCTLTPAGIMILTELDKLPDNLDKNTIRARSKAIYYVDDSEHCRKGRDICSRMEQVRFELAASLKAKKAPSSCARRGCVV